MIILREVLDMTIIRASLHRGADCRVEILECLGTLLLVAFRLALLTALPGDEGLHSSLGLVVLEFGLWIPFPLLRFFGEKMG